MAEKKPANVYVEYSVNNKTLRFMVFLGVETDCTLYPIGKNYHKIFSSLRKPFLKFWLIMLVKKFLNKTFLQI